MTSLRPGDFDSYWSGIDAELELCPANLELEALPLRSNEHANLFGVHVTSIGPYRIFGYLSVPVGDGPFPGLLQTPGYGSVNHIPDYNDRMRYICLTIMHRGQRLADQPYAAAYPGLLTDGIDDPDTYIYRSITADCLRAAEVLSAHPLVDPERLAVQGNDLALITAARRQIFDVLLHANPMFYRLDDKLSETLDYPLEELRDVLRANPERAEDVQATCRYFDPQFHAPRIQAATIFSMSAESDPGTQDWFEPLLSALGGSAQIHSLTHRGSADREMLDALLADRFAVPPMPRFQREF